MLILAVGLVPTPRPSSCAVTNIVRPTGQGFWEVTRFVGTRVLDGAVDISRAGLIVAAIRCGEFPTGIMTAMGMGCDRVRSVEQGESLSRTSGGMYCARDNRPR
jgi:hypothetical protein